MKVAGCQVPEIVGDVAGSVSTIGEFASRAESRGADLVCFPECYLQGYRLTPQHVRQSAFELNSPTLCELLRRLESVQPVLVIGLIERSGEDTFNTAAVVHRGRILGRYRKVHLLSAEAPLFAAGSATPVFGASGGSFGINICNDLNFAGAAAAIADGGAAVLVAPCNNMLPSPVSEAWRDRHNPIRSLRAKETGLWLVSSDVCGRGDDHVSHGPTAVIDPQGRLVEQLPVGRPGIVVVDIQ